MGRVFLVGAGPGDVRLITLKASELIRTCDVLVFDHLANSELRKGVAIGCEQIDVGKSPGRHTMEQEEIGKILVQKAREGKKVVRLKGGDPFVFGRCAEEMIVLNKEGIAFEIVPGVTAALACAAYAGIPLSHRDYGSSISFLTGHEDIEKESLRVNFKKFAEVGGTLCIYMGMGKLEEIISKLLKGGLSPDKPAAIVSQGTLPNQRKVVSTLDQIVEDAKKAVDVGASAIMLSNHGGRQLDGARSPFDQLAEVVDAVGDKVDVVCEGGIRRGTHVLKALSLGAKACSGGRMYLYALAAGGQKGVEKTLSNLRNEIERDMKLMGVSNISQLSQKNLRFR